jgi:hypothetical protein
VSEDRKTDIRVAEKGASGQVLSFSPLPTIAPRSQPRPGDKSDGRFHFSAMLVWC